MHSFGGDILTESEIFEEFITDRMGCTLIYHPENKGFVYFKMNGELCSIIELYSSFRHRSAGVAKWLMRSVEDMARLHNCKHVSCTVTFNTTTAEQALGALIHYGFKVGELKGNQIFMIKEL